MGLKLSGFVCYNCSTFSKYTGVKYGTGLLEHMEQNNTLNTEKFDIAFSKIPDWKYYNVYEIDDEWISWKNSESICLCPKCDRLIKLNKLINNINA